MAKMIERDLLKRDAKLGTSIHYDVAEVVDSRPYVVAKLSKDVLVELRQQTSPSR
jgi:hypothetical protein